jgi:tRNA 2-thiouridine synthesizing protein C
MMKSYLFIIRTPAHSGVLVQETLDIILTAAAFEQRVGLLFLDDGIFQLKNHQQPEAHGRKDTAALFRALELYDVTEIYTEAETLAERGLVVADLVLPVQVLARAAVSAWVGGFEVVF